MFGNLEFQAPNLSLNRTEMVESEDLSQEEQRIRHLDDLRNEMGFSMVFITESKDFAKDDLAIFPPINHENIYIDKDRESPSESSSPSSSSRLSDSSSSLSPSDSDIQFEFDRKSHSQSSKTVGKSILQIDILQCWWKLLLERGLSNFQRSVNWFSRNSLCSFSRTLRSFYPVMVMAILWWMRNRARRQHGEGEIAAHLRNTIKERDERIVQLLHQIAQMNELLVKKIHSN